MQYFTFSTGMLGNLKSSEIVRLKNYQRERSIMKVLEMCIMLLLMIHALFSFVG